MANTLPAVTVTFERALEDFKKDLSPDEIHDFSFATLMDLKKLVNDIQTKQGSSRRLKNMNRLAPFLEAMQQYDRIVQVFLNTTNLLAFIWGPVKFLLEVASTFNESFNALLDAYQDIGETLPLLANYERILQQNSALQPVLGLIYKDIMQFHRSAMKYFKGPIWRQIFQAVWKSFKTQFSQILANLERHKKMVGSHADLALLEQIREGRAHSEAKFKVIEQEEARKRRSEVTRWLSAADSSRDQSLASSKRAAYPQTGTWLLQQSSVRKWRDDSNRLDPILWINGKPGAGKTVLASLLIAERQICGAATAFFFCKNGDPTRNSAIAVFRGVLLQLMDIKPSLVPYVYDVASASGRNTLDNPVQASEILDVVSRDFDRLYMVIDGLDECPQNEKAAIAKWCLTMTKNGPNPDTGFPRCCLFSQDDNDMRFLLKNITTFKITSQHNKDDISIYCNSQADNLRAKFGLIEDEANDVSITVSERADGMFIYARLVMETLLSQVSRRGFLKEREKLPADLDQVYGRIVDRVLHESEPAECSAAKSTLSWLVCATRPLKWFEIQGAASFDPDDHSFDFEDGKFRHSPKELCGSLIEIVEGEEIRLVHLTAKTYLEKNVISVSEHELGLLCHCLDYLQLPAFHNDLSEGQITKFVLDGYYSFMDYATANWCTHLHNVLKSSQHHHDQLNRLRTLLGLFFSTHPKYMARRHPISGSITTLLRPFSSEGFYEDLCYVLSLESITVYGNPNEAATFQENSSHFRSSIPSIRSVIENIASGSDLSKIERLNELYGSKHFKCSRTYCHYFHEGFTVPGDRDHHIAKHQRPYRCTFPGCPVYTIGYKTERELKKHTSDYHEWSMEEGTFPQIESIPASEVCRMIRKGALDDLDAWIEHFNGSVPISEVWSNTHVRPLRTAYEKGDQQAVAMLLDHVDPALFDDEKAMEKIIRGTINVHNESAAVNVLKQTSCLTDARIYELFKATLREGLDRVSCELLSQPDCGISSVDHRSKYCSDILRSRRMAVTRFLVLEKGINANVLLHTGFTLLDYAAEQNDIQLAEILLLSSTSITMETKVSAAQLAVAHDYVDFVHVLCNTESGTNEDERIINGMRLLHAARDADFDQVNQIISEGNVLIRLHDSSGKSALYYGIEKNDTLTVRNLLGPDELMIDTSPAYLVPGQNILTCAIKNDNAEIVRLLLTHQGLKWNRVPLLNPDGTYDEIAKELGNTEIIDLLAAHGPKKDDHYQSESYQVQLMLLEQNKNRLMIARQAQDALFPPARKMVTGIEGAESKP